MRLNLNRNVMRYSSSHWAKSFFLLSSFFLSPSTTCYRYSLFQLPCLPPPPPTLHSASKFDQPFFFFPFHQSLFSSDFLWDLSFVCLKLNFQTRTSEHKPNYSTFPQTPTFSISPLHQLSRSQWQKCLEVRQNGIISVSVVRPL